MTVTLRDTPCSLVCVCVSVGGDRVGWPELGEIESHMATRLYKQCDVHVGDHAQVM